MPVFGLLTDLVSFRFYAYDPKGKKFHRIGISREANTQRDQFRKDIITNKTYIRAQYEAPRHLPKPAPSVSNTIFSILMFVYIENLKCQLETSRNNDRAVAEESNPVRLTLSVLGIV